MKKDLRKWILISLYENIYYDTENDTYLSKGELKDFYTELVNSDSGLSDMSFSDFLNDALSKNGSLLTLTDRIDSLIDDLGRYSFSIDIWLNTFSEFDKIRKVVDDYFYFEDFLEDRLKQAGIIKK